MIKNDLEQFGYNSYQLADMLVRRLYSTNNSRKEVLWRVFGKEILEHMQQNIPAPKTRIVQCVDCGEYFETATRNATRCHECQTEYRKFQKLLTKRNATIHKHTDGLVIPPDVLAQLNACNGDFSNMPIITL